MTESVTTATTYCFFDNNHDTIMSRFQNVTCESITKVSSQQKYRTRLYSGITSTSFTTHHHAHRVCFYFTFFQERPLKLKAHRLTSWHVILLNFLSFPHFCPEQRYCRQLAIEQLTRWYFIIFDKVACYYLQRLS